MHEKTHSTNQSVLEEDNYNREDMFFKGIIEAPDREKQMEADVDYSRLSG